MTRINCVPPRELTDKHLVAEYREITRLPALARAAWLRGETPDHKLNPREYTLGTGHVRFFYSRLTYISLRFRALRDEMLRRKFKPTIMDIDGLLRDMPEEWLQHWVPTDKAQRINRARLKERGA